MSNINTLLKYGKFETARRKAVEALKTATASEAVELGFQLHTACRELKDVRACKSTLEELVPETTKQKIERLLRLAEDCKIFSKGMFYRNTDEAAQGLSQWEYFDILDKRAKAYFEEARNLVETTEQQKRLDQASALCNEGVFSHIEKSVNNVIAPPSPARHGKANLKGRLTFADGTPASGLTVTLGLEVAELEPDGRRYTKTHLEVYEPAHSPIETISCVTDKDGCYAFDNIPGGIHEFLSVNLDPQKYPIAVRFFAQKIELKDGETRNLDALIQDWQSAPSRIPIADLPETIDSLKLVAVDKLRNPFGHYFRTSC